MCENGRLKELMDLPISDILRYRALSDSIDPEEALHYLADMFVDNCGISRGMRGFADYCSDYWIKKLYLNNPALKEKHHNAYTLGQLLPYISNKYYDGLLYDYDSCIMSPIELRDILVKELEVASDEKVKIILCAGICESLRDNESISWLDEYPMSKIEAGIINFHYKSIIRYRHRKNIGKYHSWRNHVPQLFTEEEVSHFITLNDRLVELQHEVMQQVKIITGNLQEQIALGFGQYTAFCIEGYIDIEDYNDRRDELFNILTDNVRYIVISSNDETPQEQIDKYISNDMHWYSNWSGIFHPLEESQGLKLCRAFRYLFEDSEVFTIEDIMKITPDMLSSHIRIDI